MSVPPKIDNAPGIRWRPIKHGWQAHWRARTDLVKRGYAFKSLKLWSSTADQREPSIENIIFIEQRCQMLQDDMIVWSHGGIPEMGVYDGTWGSLVRCYKSDPDSPYKDKRYATRDHYDTLCKRIDKDCGSDLIADADARRLKRLYEGWSAGGKTSMGHAMIGMLRTITTFGATMLKCPACKSIRMDLHDMRVKQGRARVEVLTAEQAVAICASAHPMWRRIRLSSISSQRTSKKDKLLTLDLKLCQDGDEGASVDSRSGPGNETGARPHPHIRPAHRQ